MGTLRLTGGTLRSRSVKTPSGRAVRPTPARVKEALFSILADRVDNANVLDLFAGTGALGFEALSRGAAHATFVDAGRPAVAAIRDNLRELGLEARATVIPGDAVAAAARHPGGPWRLVFVDPPYRSDLAVRAVLALPCERLAEDAVIVIEHDRRNTPPDALGSLLRTDQRRYGDTLISFYVRPPGVPA